MGGKEVGPDITSSRDIISPPPPASQIPSVASLPRDIMPLCDVIPSAETPRPTPPSEPLVFPSFV